ncbi:MAG: serine/threonine-protein kinase [Polyangiaceae bacterium]
MVPAEATTIGSSAPLPFAVTLDASDSGVSRAAVSVSVTAPDPLVAPEIPDRYQLLGPLGEGGFGRVDAVFDRQLLREVARKSLRPGGDGAGEREARFINEARITGKLEHPGIVPVHEIGRQDDGTLYYVMGLVKGHSLEEALLEKTFEERLRYLPAFVDACNAVAYAHSRGVIHRDLKPDNIMLGAFGETLVVDWGLAKVKGETDLLRPALESGMHLLQHQSGVDTVVGTAIGTPAYMPPEQCLGELDLIDERSDVYALGAVLHRLLTGEPPFAGETVPELLRATLGAPLVPPCAREAGCPPELDAIVRRALEKDPEDRYDDAGHLARDVQAFLDGGLVGAHRYTPQQRLTRWVRAHRRGLGLGSLLLALVAGGVIWADHEATQRSAEALAARAEAAAQADASRRGELLATLDRILADTAEGATTPRWLETHSLAIIALAEPVAADAVAARLTKALEHPERSVRRLAARSLAGIPRRGVAAALAARLAESGEQDEEVLVEIINALGVLGDPSADAAVSAVRWRFGQSSNLWAQTALAYRMIPMPDLPRGTAETPEAWHERGKALTEKGDREGAVEAYSKAIAIDPTFHKAYNNRALGLVALERYPEAIADYTQAIAHDPEGGDTARYNRAVLKRKLDDFDGAIADYSALVDKGFRLPVVLRGRAVAHSYRGDDEAALADLERAQEEEARPARTYLALSSLYADLGRREEAVGVVGRALALNPDWPDALVQRAQDEYLLGRQEAALADLDRAIDVDPNHESARLARAALRLSRGDVKGALGDANHCLDRRCSDEPNQRPVWLRNRAVAFHAARGDFREAHRDLAEAYPLAHSRSLRVELAIFGALAAQRLAGPEERGVWRARLAPETGAQFPEALLRVVARELDADELVARQPFVARRCAILLASALADELDGGLAAARARYQGASEVSRPFEPACLLASALASAQPED